MRMYGGGGTEKAPKGPGLEVLPGLWNAPETYVKRNSLNQSITCLDSKR